MSQPAAKPTDQMPDVMDMYTELLNLHAPFDEYLRPFLVDSVVAPSKRFKMIQLTRTVLAGDKLDLRDKTKRETELDIAQILIQLHTQVKQLEAPLKGPAKPE